MHRGSEESKLRVPVQDQEGRAEPVLSHLIAAVHQLNGVLAAQDGGGSIRAGRLAGAILGPHQVEDCCGARGTSIPAGVRHAARRDPGLAPAHRSALPIDSAVACVLACGCHGAASS